jgi:hypothetical protein
MSVARAPEDRACSELSDRVLDLALIRVAGREDQAGDLTRLPQAPQTMHDILVDGPAGRAVGVEHALQERAPEMHLHGQLLGRIAGASDLPGSFW